MLSDNDTLKLYMRNINEYPLLSQEEENELAARVAQGDKAAQARLVRCNLRLVVKIAHDFKNIGLPLLDLISEGNIGLMRAVEKFDPSKGAKLSSYAAWWIKQAMRRALNNQTRIIRVPVQSATKISRIQTAQRKLGEELGRAPTDEEISKEVNLTERTISGLRHGRTYTVSIQSPLKAGEEGELKDILEDEKTATPDDFLVDRETLAQMLRLIPKLNDRERSILDLRFGLSSGVPRTLEQVSIEVGRTRERVRQIQNHALDKLRAMLDEEGGYEAQRLLPDPPRTPPPPDRRPPRR